jgi:hypothetical protein
MNTNFLALCLASVGLASAQPFVRAPLQPVEERKPAPVFTLKDAKGKTVNLEKYRGKVVLLDFFPWFVEFQKTYLRPFRAEHPIPYRIALGDDAMMHSFGLASLPDTFRIAWETKRVLL